MTNKALRFYDEIDLLRPVEVDRSNGYRRYSVEQIHTARLIALLRGADLGLAEIRLLPRHDEAYTTITKAQWDFAAILAAYDAVACSPDAVARPGSRLSCRKVYVAEPDTIGPEDLVCDIAFPLGED